MPPTSFRNVLSHRHRRRTQKELRAVTREVRARQRELAGVGDADLAGWTTTLRQQLADGATLDDILVDAFAVCVEASRRVLGLEPYDVQIMAGAALVYGYVCEMRTGEGKTLVATLPAYLFGLDGQGCHIVTANDYLAERDATEMGALYRFLGLDVGLISPDDRDATSKRAAYAAEITYGTAKEYGFDYLRDNMVTDAADRSQRPLVRAIIDEADAILIDEARVPLIISGNAPIDAVERYRMARIVERLVDGEDYHVDHVEHVVLPTEDGIAKVEAALDVENLYADTNQHLVYLLTAALVAKELYANDREYLVRDGEAYIIDENTGRILDGRRWADGVHQAIEAKERLSVSAETHTLATISIQNYFKLYEHVCGMTGTAADDAEELESVYGTPVCVIPTHRPDIRIDHPDVVYATEAAKLAAVIADVTERHERGQPVLLGTASVRASERLSSALTEAGVAHEVLNAKFPAQEARIIAEAGRHGAVTVATNMAGRGVDILLGGTPAGTGADGAHDEIVALGGLYVCGTERHEARRVDRQLRGRAGRQGDPGESRFYISLEDDLCTRFGTDAVRHMLGRSVDDGSAFTMRMIRRTVDATQKAVEARAAAVRGDILKYDEVWDTQRRIVYGMRNRYLSGEAFEFTATFEAAVDAIVIEWCRGYPETWELDALADALGEWLGTELVDVEALGACQDADSVRAVVRAWAHGARDARGVDTDVERVIALATLDSCWRAHLVEMDELHSAVGLRAMGQLDPLVEWRRDAALMFESMLERARAMTVWSIVSGAAHEELARLVDDEDDDADNDADDSRDDAAPTDAGAVDEPDGSTQVA